MNALHAVALAASLSVFAIVAAPAGAQVKSQCLAAQLKASGALTAAKAACEAKALAKGNATDRICLAKAAQKAINALAKAEKKGDCRRTGRTERVTERVDEYLALVGRNVSPPPSVCCQFDEQCTFLDRDDCETFDGTVGGEGTVCSGSGTCAPPPVAPGSSRTRPHRSWSPTSTGS
jgi:hypothetical protein